MDKNFYPALFHSADQMATNAQKEFLRIRTVEFALLTVGAASGALSTKVLWESGPFIALILILVAIIIRVSGQAEKAERQWYDGRAAAESIKSSAWQYAMAGEAYRKSDPTANSRFYETLKGSLLGLKNLNLAPTSKAEGSATSQMSKLRRATIADRKSEYKEFRIKDQVKWYKKKSEWNKKQAIKWKWILVSVEAIAVFLGLLRAVGWFDVDWLGVFAGFAIGIAAWQQMKQFTMLSESYAVTGHDITMLKNSIDDARSEKDWSKAIHDAEAAFSREHTRWVSRKQGPETS